MAERLRVLFLCTGNSCRSRMAEGWARALKGDVVEAHSAGTAPQGLNPRAAQVMTEAGVDISHHQSKSVADYLSRKWIIRAKGVDWFQAGFPRFLTPVSIIALLATLVRLIPASR